MGKIEVNYTPNAKQSVFHSCGSSEVVYGGAKGGGKSCALVMETLAYGLENAGAVIYLFRETYDDLEANLILEWKAKVPKEVYTYSETKHIATLTNKSVVYFRYVTNVADAEGYQGRSIDYIGVDELTRHTEKAIQILLSCLRSPKGFKPVFKGTCNPGGIGHAWVKQRYILATDYGKNVVTDDVSGNTISFIPATVYDNDVIMRNDPAYVKRLENLPENEKKAFLYGDWDIFEGQYFTEFKSNIHIIKPFPIPKDWKRYISIDYGRDMLAALWFAVDWQGKIYCYKELYQSNLIVSDAAEAIKNINGDDVIAMRFAPPDLWNKQSQTGKSTIEMLGDNGLYFYKASNDRVQGWYNLKEWLKPYKDEQGIITAKLTFFTNCRNLIRTLPQLQYSNTNPNDVANEPHELTHAPDSLRYFISGRPSKPVKAIEYDEDYVDSDRSFLDYGV